MSPIFFVTVYNLFILGHGSSWSHPIRSFAVKSLLIKPDEWNTCSKGTAKSNPSYTSGTFVSETVNREQMLWDVILNSRGGAPSSDDIFEDGYEMDSSEMARIKGNNHNHYNGYTTNNGQQGYSYSSSSSSKTTRDSYQNDYHSEDRKYGYYDEEGRYREDDDDRVRRGNHRRSSLPQSNISTVLTSGNRKLGMILLSSGAAFTALGITLFFNKTLMRLGNILFVVGVPLMIGPSRTMGYFLQPKKARATGCLACGIFLVLVGHPVIGILLEFFGLLNLFGNMFPLVMMMAKNLPVLGGLFGGENGNGEDRRERRKRESAYDGAYYDDQAYKERAYRHDRY